MTVAKTLVHFPGGDRLEAERDGKGNLTLVASNEDARVRIHMPDEYLEKLAQALIDLRRQDESLPTQKLFSKGVMCKTDFEDELGLTPVIIYPSVSYMETRCKCTPPGEATCGIVAVDVMFRCLERMPDVENFETSTEEGPDTAGTGVPA